MESYPCLPSVHRTADFPLQLSLPLCDTTRLHTACSLSQFSVQCGMGLLCCSPSTATRWAGPFSWPKLGTFTSFTHSPTQEFTHPQLSGEIMQHVHWHSVSIGNNLKIHALFPHEEKEKASEKYTIIILKELVQ